MKNKLKSFAGICATPLLLMLFGLILVVHPDTATALVAQLIGGLLVLVSLIWGLAMVIAREFTRVGSWVGLALCLGVGCFILLNPMILADSISRFFGLMMIIHGAGLMRKTSHNGDGFSMGVAIVTLVVGIVLVLVPRTLSRTVVGVCGLVMMALGVCNLVGGFRAAKRRDRTDDPNIIDAAR